MALQRPGDSRASLRGGQLCCLVAVGSRHWAATWTSGRASELSQIFVKEPTARGLAAGAFASFQGRGSLVPPLGTRPHGSRASSRSLSPAGRGSPVTAPACGLSRTYSVLFAFWVFCTEWPPLGSTRRCDRQLRGPRRACVRAQGWRARRAQGACAGLELTPRSFPASLRCTARP